MLPDFQACLYGVSGSVTSMNGGKQAKTIIGIIFIGSALLTAAACGSAHTDSGALEVAPVGEAVAGLTSPGDPSQEPGGTASAEKAAAAAVNAVAGSTALSVQSENGGAIWGVQLADPDGTERLLEVDASGKALSEARVKDTGKEEKTRVKGIIKGAKVTFEEAARKVSSAVPQGKIAHMSLDRYSNDLLVWDVDVVTSDGTWHEVKVDAKTGAVAKNG